MQNNKALQEIEALDDDEFEREADLEPIKLDDAAIRKALGGIAAAIKALTRPDPTARNLRLTLLLTGL